MNPLSDLELDELKKQIVARHNARMKRDALESLKKVFSKSGNATFTKDQVLKEFRFAIEALQEEV